MSKSQVLDILKNLDFPKNTSRQNIFRGKQQSYEGMVLGMVNARGLGKMMSKKTKMDKYKPLYESSKKLMKTRDPNFKFTSIQVNKNQRTAKHTDSRNVGESYIVGLGNYSGGEILIYDEDGKNPKKVDIKNKFVKFNGSKLPHETAPFKGQRYTLVYYKI